MYHLKGKQVLFLITILVFMSNLLLAHGQSPNREDRKVVVSTIVRIDSTQGNDDTYKRYFSNGRDTLFEQSFEKVLEEKLRTGLSPMLIVRNDTLSDYQVYVSVAPDSRKQQFNTRVSISSPEGIIDDTFDNALNTNFAFPPDFWVELESTSSEGEPNKIQGYFEQLSRRFAERIYGKIDRLLVQSTISIRIIVDDFEYIGGSASLDYLKKQLKIVVESEFSKSQSILVYSPKKSDTTQAIKRYPINYKIEGSFSEYGDKLRIDLRCVKHTSDVVIASQRALFETTALDSLSQGVEKISNQLKKLMEADFRPQETYVAVVANPPSYLFEETELATSGKKWIERKSEADKRHSQEIAQVISRELKHYQEKIVQKKSEYAKNSMTMIADSLKKNQDLPHSDSSGKDKDAFKIVNLEEQIPDDHSLQRENQKDLSTPQKTANPSNLPELQIIDVPIGLLELQGDFEPANVMASLGSDYLVSIRYENNGRDVRLSASIYSSDPGSPVRSAYIYEKLINKSEINVEIDNIAHEIMRYFCDGEDLCKEALNDVEINRRFIQMADIRKANGLSFKVGATDFWERRGEKGIQLEVSYTYLIPNFQTEWLEMDFELEPSLGFSQLDFGTKEFSINGFITAKFIKSNIRRFLFIRNRLPFSFEGGLGIGFQASIDRYDNEMMESKPGEYLATVSYLSSVGINVPINDNLSLPVQLRFILARERGALVTWRHLVIGIKHRWNR